MTGSEAIRKVEVKPAVMLLWVSLEPRDKQMYSQWHSSEHLRDRFSVPGFLDSRRYEHVDRVTGGIEYLVFHETESAEAFASPGYTEQLDDPSPWSREVFGSMHNSKGRRMVSTIVADRGHGAGGSICTIEFETAGPFAPGADTLPITITEGRNESAVVRARLLKPDDEFAKLRDASVEAKLLAAREATEAVHDSAADQSASEDPERWICLLEGVDPGRLRSAAREWTAGLEADVVGEPLTSEYQLVQFFAR